MDAFMPLLPLIVVAALVALIGVAGGRLGLRLLVRLVVVALGGVAAYLLLPLAVSRVSPAVPWLHLGTAVQTLQWDWTAGRGWLAATFAALGAVGIAFYGWHVLPGVRTGTPTLLGLLLGVLGGVSASGATAALPLVLSLGVMGMGGLVAELSSMPSDADATLGGIGSLLTALLLLAGAAVIDPSFARTGTAWIAGCLVLLFAGPWRMLRGRVPLGVRVAALAVGVPLGGGYALVWALTRFPGVWLPAAFQLLTGLGLAALVGGALVTVWAQRLPTTIAGAWLAQQGLFLVALGGRGAALPVLVHGTATTLLLGLAVAFLARSARTVEIAVLPGWALPLRRTALVYGVAAASVLGFPLTLGYVVITALVASQPPWLTALVLGALGLLALGLLPPLAACVRGLARPVATPTPVDEAAVGPVLVAVLALFAGRGAVAVQSFLVTPVLHWSLLAPLGWLALGIVVVGLAGRRLRRAAPPLWVGGEAVTEEQGWALPWAGLRRSLALPALGALRPPAWPWLGNARTVLTVIAERYYLSFVLLVVLIVVLLAAGRGS